MTRMKKGSSGALRSYNVIDYGASFVQIIFLVFAIFIENFWFMLLVMILILIVTSLLKGLVKSILLTTKYRRLVKNEFQISRTLDIVILISFLIGFYLVAIIFIIWL